MSTYLDKYEPFLALLDFGLNISQVEAEQKAEKCFMAQAMLVRDLHSAEYGELLLGDDAEMTSSELMLQSPADLKNAPSREAWVFTRPVRREKFEKYAAAKVKAEQLKRMLKLFEQAQYYFGNRAKR